RPDDWRKHATNMWLGTTNASLRLRADIRFSSQFVTCNLFPVISLFLYMPLAKTCNPCGFSNPLKKIPCYFPCYQELRMAESLWVCLCWQLATGNRQLTTALPSPGP